MPRISPRPGLSVFIAIQSSLDGEGTARRRFEADRFQKKRRMIVQRIIKSSRTVRSAKRAMQNCLASKSYLSLCKTKSLLLVLLLALCALILSPKATAQRDSQIKPQVAVPDLCSFPNPPANCTPAPAPIPKDERKGIALGPASVLRQDAIMGDQDLRGPTAHGVSLPDFEIGIVDDRMLQLVAQDNAAYVIRLFFVIELGGVNTYHDEVVAILGFESFKVGDDVDTVDATVGPEIQQHDFAAQRGE